jgi:hypothetical protein
MSSSSLKLDGSSSSTSPRSPLSLTEAGFGVLVPPPFTPSPPHHHSHYLPCLLLHRKTHPPHCRSPLRQINQARIIRRYLYRDLREWSQGNRRCEGMDSSPFVVSGLEALYGQVRARCGGGTWGQAPFPSLLEVRCRSRFQSRFQQGRGVADAKGWSGLLFGATSSGAEVEWRQPRGLGPILPDSDELCGIDPSGKTIRGPVRGFGERISHTI